MREYKYKGQKYQSMEKISPDIVKKYDIVIVTAGHTTIDYDMVAENAVAVFDTKNAMKNVKNRTKIELL